MDDQIWSWPLLGDQKRNCLLLMSNQNWSWLLFSDWKRNSQPLVGNQNESWLLATNWNWNLFALVCDQRRSSQPLTDDQNGSWPFMGGQNTEVLEGSHHMTMDLNFSEFFSFIKKEERKNGLPKCKSFPNSFWVRNSFPQLKRVNGSEY